MRTYTADGRFVPDPKIVAPFADLTMICWIHPEFLLDLELIPVAAILSFNLLVLLAAVFFAYQSSTFRLVTHNEILLENPKNIISGMSRCRSS